MIFRTGNGVIQRGDEIISSNSYRYQGVRNWFLKQEMQLSKWEMESFLHFQAFLSKYLL